MHTETRKNFSHSQLMFFYSFVVFIYVEDEREKRIFFPLHVVIPSMPMHILLYNKIGTRKIVTEYSLNIEICAYKQRLMKKLLREVCDCDAFIVKELEIIGDHTCIHGGLGGLTLDGNFFNLLRFLRKKC